MAQIVKDTDGAIGYVDLSDAKATGLTFASIKNKDGQFVQPTLEGATAALAGAEVKADLTYGPLNAAGAEAYPITASTYVLVYATISDATKAQAIRGLADLPAHRRPGAGPDVDFAPLPDGLQAKALAQIDQIQG